MTRVRPRRAFSLVELMLTLTIIGVLLTLALPRLNDLQLRARRAELPANLGGLRVAVVARDAELGGFISAEPYPADLGKHARPWVVEDSGDFQLIGWNPDGHCRGRYTVEGGETDFVIRGETDADGDGVIATWESSLDTQAMPLTPDDVY